MIERGGQKVNRIMIHTGARIELKTSADRTGHDVVISGFPNAVQVTNRVFV